MRYDCPVYHSENVPLPSVIGSCLYSTEQLLLPLGQEEEINN